MTSVGTRYFKHTKDIGGLTFNGLYNYWKGRAKRKRNFVFPIDTSLVEYNSQETKDIGELSYYSLFNYWRGGFADKRNIVFPMDTSTPKWDINRRTLIWRENHK